MQLEMLLQKAGQVIPPENSPKIQRRFTKDLVRSSPPSSPSQTAKSPSITAKSPSITAKSPSPTTKRTDMTQVICDDVIVVYGEMTMYRAPFQLPYN